MNMQQVFHTIAIGIGATISMDAWGVFMKALGLKGLNMAHLGRWILSWPSGKWFHQSIANSPGMDGELIVGWLAHYSIGILFSFILVATYGTEWLQRPTLKGALVIGLGTVLAPLVILQPALGLGYFASRAPHPMLSVLRSVGSHLIFGVGLYLTAQAIILLRQR